MIVENSKIIINMFPSLIIVVGYHLYLFLHIICCILIYCAYSWFQKKHPRTLDWVQPPPFPDTGRAPNNIHSTLIILDGLLELNHDAYR